jgi:hypothetical protein
MIFAQPRSGSSTLLELFSTSKIKTLYEPMSTAGSNKWPEKMKEKLWNRTWEERIKEIQKSDFLVFKHVYNQATEEQNLRMISMFPTLFLWRSDLIMASVSWAVAETTCVWHNVVKNKDYFGLISLNPERVIEIYRMNYVFRQKYLMRKNQRHIMYENLYHKNADVRISEIKRAFAFAKIQDFDLERCLYLTDPKNKLNKDNWIEKIDNWKQILREIKKFENSF